MPTVTPTLVTAFAHCRDARCSGYHQQTVDAIREETSWTFGDGDRLGAGVLQNTVEKSHVEHRFADLDDAPCPVCGTDREVTGDPRPQYVNESGHDPLGLLGLPKFDGQKSEAAALNAYYGPSASETDEEIESRLRAKLREEAIEARLREEMQG